MIITQTPLRISFLGGGTDFGDYYRKEGGCVVTSAIDKYIYVIIKERFDDKIRVGYTRTELVDRVEEVDHDLVRECLRRTGITKGVEISTMGDIPSEGSGLGSSSTVTVGLLNAMYAYIGHQQEAETLARQACEIEIEALGKPVGVQDQYIAAYGGQRFIRFCEDGSVQAEHLFLTPDQTRRLNQNLMLFFTGVTRKAESVLYEQVATMNSKMPMLRELKRLAVQAKATLEAGDFDHFGALLHEGWVFKQQMASGISNPKIDWMYETARDAGAIGGKISGAGGGGYLMLYCPRANQDAVRSALSKYYELSFHLERDGSKVIFNYRR